jgi:hypothetical protein
MQISMRTCGDRLVSIQTFRGRADRKFGISSLNALRWNQTGLPRETPAEMCVSRAYSLFKTTNVSTSHKHLVIESTITKQFVTNELHCSLVMRLWPRLERTLLV